MWATSTGRPSGQIFSVLHCNSEQQGAALAQEKVPAFQFYPKDFLSDSNVQAMSHTERGIYITLLSHCWLDGSLPGDMKQLARMAQLPAVRFERLWHGPLSRCFQANGDGRLHHKRLDAEREKQTAYRRRQADAAALRWDKPATPEPMPEPSHRNALHSLSPISDLQLKTEREKGDEIDRRAGELLRNYQRWYSEERHGARLKLIGNQLEFEDARDIVRTWEDDGWIEQMARVVLTTTIEKFILNSDRGFKVFAIKASWADARLREAEQSA